MERQAFEAVLRIRNGLANLELSDVAVEVRIRDMAGQDVPCAADPAATNAFFFLRQDRIEGLPSLDGTGAIPPGASVEARWLLIPAPGAGSDQGVAYEVGARLSYRLAGQSHAMDLVPDTITVLPMPDLGIDLFVPEWVSGDDPRTQRSEAPIPFPVGVRVRNAGPGGASAVSLELGQPRIIDNLTGLRIAFAVVGCDVNGAAEAASLRAAIGTVPAGGAAVARWRMAASLAGTFSDVDVSASHADELGGRLTALIREENVRARRLRKDVRVDLAGRDDRVDFLAVDGQLFESDGRDGRCEDRSAWASLSADAHAVTVTFASTGGMSFVCLPLPADRWPAGTVAVRSATRADGLRVLADNAWTEMRRNALGAWEAWVGLFDPAPPVGSACYRVELAPAGVNLAPRFLPLTDVQARPGRETAFRVEAVDPDGTVPCVLPGVLPAGAVFAPDGENAGWVRWIPSESQAGAYRVKFTATDGALDASLWVSVDVASAASERATILEIR